MRVIAATNKDLEEEIAEGRFREDLYFRLSVIPIAVPPLRERLDDIPALIQHFVAQFSRDNNRRAARFAPGALEALKQARWRGNIRELKNAVERLLIMSDSDVIDTDDAKYRVFDTRPAAASPAAAHLPPPPPRPCKFGSVERAFLVAKLLYLLEYSRTAKSSTRLAATPTRSGPYNISRSG